MSLAYKYLEAAAKGLYSSSHQNTCTHTGLFKAPQSAPMNCSTARQQNAQITAAPEITLGYPHESDWALGIINNLI